MAITKYMLRRPAFSSWADMDRISNRFARIFDDPVFGAAPKERWSPALSVSENDDELLLTLELPGLGEEDIIFTSVTLALLIVLSGCHIQSTRTVSLPHSRRVFFR